jgi:hypothetical protein
VKHRSLTGWLVAAVCFGPFIVALLIYYSPLGRDWLPQLPGSREVLAQPIALPATWRAGAGEPAVWQLVYASTRPCEDECARHLGRLLQVQLALGRDQDRVSRALWHVGSLPELDDFKLTARSLESAEGATLAAALGAEPLEQGRVLVAAPRGEVIVSYPPEVEQKELLRDLKRLLGGPAS